VVGAVVVVAAMGAETATAQYLGGGRKSSAEAQIADLEQLAEKFVALAGAFPDEQWDWRPMEGVRSVRDVLALIATEPTLFPTMWGFDAPSWVPVPQIGAELERNRSLSPDDTLEEIRRAFGHVVEVARGLEETDRRRSVPFFGLQVPVETAITLMANDMHEHLGQLIAYARMNGIVPPWSRSGS
jgi:uncharacterized damage-inducible protein DinB